MATINPLLQQIDAIAKEKGVEPEIIIGAVQDALEAAARKREAAEQEQHAEDRRPGGPDRDTDGAAERLAEIAALALAERLHQAERDDGEAGGLGGRPGRLPQAFRRSPFLERIQS